MRCYVIVIVFMNYFDRNPFYSNTRIPITGKQYTYTWLIGIYLSKHVFIIILGLFFLNRFNIYFRYYHFLDCKLEISFC